MIVFFKHSRKVYNNFGLIKRLITFFVRKTWDKNMENYLLSHFEICIIWVFEFCHILSLTIWVFVFCHTYSFWDLSQQQFLISVTFWVFGFCHNKKKKMIFVTIKVFEFCQCQFFQFWLNMSFWALSQFGFFSFVTI